MNTPKLRVAFRPIAKADDEDNEPVLEINSREIEVGVTAYSTAEIAAIGTMNYVFQAFSIAPNFLVKSNGRAWLAYN
jgi:hypothetical protein